VEADAQRGLDFVASGRGVDPKSLFTLARCWLRVNNTSGRRVFFARVNELNPHTYEVLYDLGIALYNLDRNADAAKYLAEGADLNPGPAETHFRLALDCQCPKRSSECGARIQTCAGA